MNCGCNSGRLGYLAAGTMPGTEAVTANDTCHELHRAYLLSSSTWDRIKYNLCLAERNAVSFITDSGHWFFGVLDNLWNELWGLTKSAGSAIASAAQTLLSKTEQALQWTRAQLGRIADNLYSEFGSVAKWALILGGLFLAVELSPAINDGVHSLTRKFR